MQSQSITITFCKRQRRHIDELMNYFRAEKEHKYKNHDDIFKQNLMGYLTAVKGQQEVIRQLKNIIKQKKIQIESKGKINESSYELTKSLKQLKKYITQKQNDSECYTFYISFMNQLKDMKAQSLPTFQRNLKNIKTINCFQSSNILWAARKIIKWNQDQQKIHDLKAVSQVLTQILRYGFQEKIHSLEKITDKSLLQKFQALKKNIQNNYIEIQSNVNYGLQNPLNQFMRKIVVDVYRRQQLQKLIQKMPYKLQDMTKPLLQYVFTLKQNTGQKSRQVYLRGGLYQSYQLKKAEQQSIEQLICDFNTSNKKNDRLQAEINELKRFITLASSLTSNYKQKGLNEEITKYIERCQGEEFQHNLRKIYQKLNNFGYKQPQHKTFRQNRENELLHEKLNKKIQKLEQEIKSYRNQIGQLEQQRAQSLEQRIQMLKSIQQYKERTEQKDQQINKLQSSMQKYKKVQEEKRELQNLKRLLQERQEQRSAQLADEKNKNKQYKKQIDHLMVQKEQLVENNTSLIRQIQLLKQQLSQKVREDSLKSDTQISINLQERNRNFEAEVSELRQKNEGLNIIITQLRQQNQQINEKIIEMAELKRIVQQLNKQNDILSDSLETFIKKKEIASEKGSFLNKCQDDLLAQIAALKAQIEILVKNEVQTRERQKQCEIELNNLKNLFQGLLKQYQEKEYIIKQHQIQNQALNKEIIEIKHSNQQLVSFQMKQLSNRQNKFLQSQLEQAKKFNELIKNQYMNFKEQSKNALKAQIEEQIVKFKQNQEKLRDNYRKLHQLFLAQKDKMAIIKSENQQLTKSRTQQNSKQFVSLRQIAERSELQQNYKDLVKKYQSLKTFSQRSLIKKQQEIANLKLELIKSQRNSSNQIDTQQQKITQQKLDYLQGEFYQLKQQNSKLRMQLQRRQQEILILKMQALK